MIRYDAGTTNPTLLNRLGDWRDHEAWVDFVTRYDPVIRSLPSIPARRRDHRRALPAGLDRSGAANANLPLRPREDVSRLAPPVVPVAGDRSAAEEEGRRRASRWRTTPAASLLQDAADGFDAEEGAASERPLLLRLAEQVQDGVRRRVEERTWQVFWKIAVLGQSVREASEAAGISYYAAFAAQKRVGRMLREEGQRLMAERRVMSQSRTDRRLIEPSDGRRGAPCPHAPHPRRSAGSHTLRRAVRDLPRWKPMSKHAPTVRTSWSGWPLIRRRARIVGPNGCPPPEQPPTIPGFVIERELGRGEWGSSIRRGSRNWPAAWPSRSSSASVGIGAEDRRRWLREARAIGRVRHRNVVQLHEAGEQDGCLYLVLDLITGGSLADRVTGPLPARVAVELMAAVARAVDQIHQAGMLHLDIKPSNILLDGPPDGPWDQVTPMLADFGIARAGDDPGATATGPIGVRGTPSFMAPEQIAGDRAGIGPRSDVFALGATLYSLLTGRPPFQAASVIETLDLVRTREPAPPRTLVPGLPRDLETIALTCLRKDPRRRYASAVALADDLQRWLDGFPIRRVRYRSSNTPLDGAGAGRRSRRCWLCSPSPWRRASWACSHSGAIPKPSARGPRMPWPVPSRATRPRPARSAISSACWRRPWKHRKCSRLNDS